MSTKDMLKKLVEEAAKVPLGKRPTASKKTNEAPNFSKMTLMDIIGWLNANGGDHISFELQGRKAKKAEYVAAAEKFSPPKTKPSAPTRELTQKEIAEWFAKLR